MRNRCQIFEYKIKRVESETKTVPLGYCFYSSLGICSLRFSCVYIAQRTKAVCRCGLSMLSTLAAADKMRFAWVHHPFVAMNLPMRVSASRWNLLALWVFCSNWYEIGHQRKIYGIIYRLPSSIDIWNRMINCKNNFNISRYIGIRNKEFSPSVNRGLHSINKCKPYIWLCRV